MEKSYDKVISKHYASIAKKKGLSSSCSMDDEITRDLETEAIKKFVGFYLCRDIKNKSRKRPLSIMDVGCGNGYTLSVLSKKYPNEKYFGIEKSNELRELAKKRFKKSRNVKIYKGDIREKNFNKGIHADILICQRVLINILEREDQIASLDNIINAAVNEHNEGHNKLLFIESFNSPLKKLNKARAEFNLSPISEAIHNLYLDDDIFVKNKRLKLLQKNDHMPPSNFLSTHYYVTRVLHPLVTSKNQFIRNSEFVKFFSKALLQNSGDYSPLKIFCFKAIS